MIATEKYTVTWPGPKPAVSIKMGPNLVTKREQMMTRCGWHWHHLLLWRQHWWTMCWRDTKVSQQEKDATRIHGWQGEHTWWRKYCYLRRERSVKTASQTDVAWQGHITVKKNSKSKATVKARSNKKQIALLQGQRQLTSFFRWWTHDNTTSELLL